MPVGMNLPPWHTAPEGHGVGRKRALAYAAFVTLLAAHAFLVLVAWARWLGTPRAVGGIETFVLNGVIGWKCGFPAYTRLDRLPATWSPYGVVYQACCAWLPCPRWNPYLPGRLLSLLAGAGVLALAARRCRKFGGPAPVVAASILLCLTARPFFVFTTSYRVDAVAAFLSLLGFHLVVDARRRAALWLGVLVLALAAHTKLTAGAGPAAAAVALWPRDRRKALAVAGGWAALFGLGLALLQLKTGGAYLHDARLLAYALRPTKVLDMATRPLVTSFGWLAALGFGYSRLGGSARRALRPDLCYAGIAWAVGAGAAVSPGSSWNYLLEAYAGLTVLTGSAGALLWKDRRGRVPAAVCLLLLAQAVGALFYTVHIKGCYDRELARRAETYRHARAVLEPLVRKGCRVAVMGPDAAVDALLSLGRPTPSPFVPRYLRPRVSALLADALGRNELDVVLCGPSLRPWKP